MIKNQAGQVVTANLIALADGTSITTGTVTVDVLGDGGTKTAGGGTIENEGGGTWSYFPTKAETNYAAVTYSFAHADALRVDVQFNPTGTGASVPTPDPGGLAGSYAEYYGGGTGTPNVATEGARSGEIFIELFVGDDYTGASALPWTVSIPDSATIGGSTCVLKFVQASAACIPFEIEFAGTLSAAADGYATMTFELLNADTSTIVEGEYFFFVTWITDAGLVITKVFNRQLVNWKAKAA